MSKSVSILGCGWLGLPLAESLVQGGDQVKGSTTQVEKTTVLREKGITPYLIDLSLNVKEGIPDDFFASDSLVVLIPPRSRMQLPGAYLSQMQQLARLIPQYPQIKHLIYTSSTSVYPDGPGVVREERVVSPEQAANSELVEVENTFSAIPGLAVTIIRLGGLTGGSRLLIRHFAGKKELKGGCYPVNLLHQDDAVNVIRFLMEKGLTGVYNACSPVHPLKKDFYTALAQRFHMPLPLFNADHREEGKTIDVSKLERAGYVFSYPDPDAYRYDQK